MEGSQDYDLLLRCLEKVDARQIVHIARVLYHWRVHAASTAMSADAKPYAMVAGERAINAHFSRLGVNGHVELIGFGYKPIYHLPDVLPLVSIIIPTRNAHALVRQCIDSIKRLTNYKNYELILVDNGSDETESLQEWRRLEAVGVKVLRDDGPFNYSSLNNKAVKVSQGEVLVLLNNDTEVIDPKWLDIMVGHALRPNIGPVGAKLLYKDKTIQHAGVVLGMGGAAGHANYKLTEKSHGYFGRASLTGNFSAVTAACLAVRRNLYLEFGGLDEVNLKVAFNDVDFCLRLGQAGYRCVYAPDAVLYHHESVSRGAEDDPQKKARFKKESEWMSNKWASLLENDPYYSPNLTLEHSDFSLAWPPRAR
jgi:GT2 family glycosyltransferase